MRVMRQCLKLAVVAFALAQETKSQQFTVPYTEGIPEDMGCMKGPNAATWQKVKARFRGIFDSLPAGPLQPAPRDWVQDAVNGAIADVQAVNGFAQPGADGEAECGYGKVMLQLLSVIAIDDPGAVAEIFRRSEGLSSPLLTVLLDVPWVETALSGWPMFGILAQVAFHKVAVAGPALDSAFIDGINDQVTLNYYNEVAMAQQTGDVNAIASATATYLNSPPTGGEESAFGQLTAAATQAAAQSGVQARLNLMHEIQRSMRDVISSKEGLEVATTSRWPIWSLLHIVADVFSESAAGAA